MEVNGTTTQCTYVTTEYVGGGGKVQLCKFCVNNLLL